MFNNFLRKGGYGTPRNISNPISSHKHLCISGGSNPENNQEHTCTPRSDRKQNIP
jgi:hypothetical protein